MTDVLLVYFVGCAVMALAAWLEHRRDRGR